MTSRSAIDPVFDTKALQLLIEAGAINLATIGFAPQGWFLKVRCGQDEKLLSTQRIGRVRYFRKIETLLGVVVPLGLARIEIEAVGFVSEGFDGGRVRPDRSVALKTLHAK